MEKIRIKGMVCNRCIAVVEKIFQEENAAIASVTLGKINLTHALTGSQMGRIKSRLEKVGFEVLDDKQARLIAGVKETVLAVFEQNHQRDTRPKFSKLLQEKFGQSYETISAVFSEVEGLTLEKYIIEKRLEKVKELLVYTDFTLTEIAYLMGFSSVHYLSRQFKDLTGLTPSYFRKVKTRKETLVNRKKGG